MIRGPSIAGMSCGLPPSYVWYSQMSEPVDALSAYRYPLEESTYATPLLTRTEDSICPPVAYPHSCVRPPTFVLLRVVSAELNPACADVFPNSVQFGFGVAEASNKSSAVSGIATGADCACEDCCWEFGTPLDVGITPAPFCAEPPEHPVTAAASTNANRAGEMNANREVMAPS